MSSRSPEEEQLEKFLGALPSWLRKVVEGNGTFTQEELSDWMQTSNWPELYGRAHDEYLNLLQQVPTKLREYRKRQARIAVESVLRGVPTLPAGAPPKTWLAKESRQLQRAGRSHREIAEELNRRHPDLTDRKGNARPITAEVVRKQLAAQRRKAPPEKT